MNRVQRLLQVYEENIERLGKARVHSERREILKRLYEIEQEMEGKQYPTREE